ncbi:hypothetical protein PWT90_09936 [Aphanocladium album]|nr:hypothetical protein PWT90_09936 [Aphanocladium album]
MNRKRPARICLRTLRRRSVVFGGLLALLLAVFCIMLLISLSTKIEATGPLTKRGLQKVDDVVHSVGEKQTEIASVTTSAASFEGKADLLGGLTGFMSHFHIDSTQAMPSSSSEFTRATTAPAVDPLTALSKAFLEALGTRAASPTDLNSPKNSIESRNYAKKMQDSILWASQPSLLTLLSDVVGQVCVIDSGAGARLLDAIFEAIHISSMDITAIISGLTEISSTSTANILPLVLPALAAALGTNVEQPRIAEHQSIQDIMSNIILHGGLFVTEIINSDAHLTSSDLYGCMNQLAGLMCAAADHLKLPTCIISKQVSSTTYQIVIPCDCASFRSLPITSQNLEDYMPPMATSTTEWNVVTLPATGGYSFTSFAPSDLPPKYAKDAPSHTTDTTRGSQSAPSNQAYGQQLQASSTSTLPPASSQLPGTQFTTSVCHHHNANMAVAEEFADAYTEPNMPATTDIDDKMRLRSAESAARADDDR